MQAAHRPYSRGKNKENYAEEKAKYSDNGELQDQDRRAQNKRLDILVIACYIIQTRFFILWIVDPRWSQTKTADNKYNLGH